MELTNIRMKRYSDTTPDDHNCKVLATASIQFDDCFVVHGLKLLELPGKRFVRFPSRRVEKYTRGQDDTEELNVSFEFADVAHPTNSSFRKYIENELFKIYDSEED